MSGIHCYVHAPSTIGWDFMYFIIQHGYCAKKELANEDMMELKAQRKDKEREEEEVTEEPKRINTGNGKGLLFEEALLIFEIQDPNVEWLMRVAAAIQNAVQCYHVTYDDEK